MPRNIAKVRSGTGFLGESVPLCPKKDKEEKVHRISTQVSTKITGEDSEEKPNFILNLLEHGEIKVTEDDEDSQQIVCVYDDCRMRCEISHTFESHGCC